MVFATQFNIFPGLIAADEVRLIYRSITRDKKLVDKVPIGINYDEFL